MTLSFAISFAQQPRGARDPVSKQHKARPGPGFMTLAEREEVVSEWQFRRW